MAAPEQQRQYASLTSNLDVLEEGEDVAGRVNVDNRAMIRGRADVVEQAAPTSRVKITLGLGAVGLFAAALLVAVQHWPGQFSVDRTDIAADGGGFIEAEIVRDGETAHGEEEKHCSGPFANCNETRCCTTPGAQCYEKAFGWATCRGACAPGPDPTDAVRGDWSCKKLGERAKGDYVEPAPGKPAAWVAKQCSNATENCIHTGCCTQPGQACFKKTDKWARCKVECTPGPDPTDNNNEDWDCEQLGGRTPGHAGPGAVADWVKEKCSAKEDNCLDSRCCRDPGHQCFQKDDKFAMCEPSCTRGLSLQDENNWKGWACKALGGRTPGPPPVPQAPKLAPWVKEHCSDYGENCASTRCCKHEASQCYSQNSSYASCLYGCVPGHKTFAKDVACNKHRGHGECEGDPQEWSCEKLGPRTPRPWGTPTLFCTHVMRVNSYEADIIRAQLAMDGKFRGGVFACDQYALYASDAPAGTYLGDGPQGPVRTRHFQSAPVWRSKDNTAANTLLFQNFWEAVRWDYQYKCCEWTIKADPDAVVLPDRLRWNLKKYGGRPTFILTCNKGFSDGPMMFGALEAVTSSAMDRYFSSESLCRSMPWQSWGEDLWLGKCLQALGIAPVEDHGIVGDNLCYGANCGNGFSGAYHPFKNKDAWMSCYWQSTR